MVAVQGLEEAMALQAEALQEAQAARAAAEALQVRSCRVAAQYHERLLEPTEQASRMRSSPARSLCIQLCRRCVGHVAAPVWNPAQGSARISCQGCAAMRSP